MFRFKQFVVRDEQCGMKVGTDGTLLGAWVPVDGVSAVSLPEKVGTAARVLDVGTGSGLIALMIAQRCPQAQVLGIDIDEAAVRQAEDNFACSPWRDRLKARLCPLQQLAQGEVTGRYDLIVSNPPYFVDSLKNPEVSRRMARHTDSLRYDELLSGSRRLLTDEGTLALILPAETEEAVVRAAAVEGLFPYKITRVRTKASKPVKRVLLAFSMKSRPVETDELVLIANDNAPRSEAYQRLCRDFYL